VTRPANPDDAARSDDRPGPRVTAVLESLARQRASGVLEIDGNPAGAIYLDRGEITYAQASWVPDLAARFCASQRPPADVRALLLGGDPDGCGPAGGVEGHRDLGATLLSCVSRAELHALLRSVIVDAVLALTVPLSGDAAVSAIRFEAPRAHWASAFARLPLEWVREEAVCRAARLARYQVSPTSTVSLRDLDHGTMVLTRDQWAVASRVGGTSTVRDLAWRSGLALCDTIECVARLVQVGACTIGQPPAAASTPSGTPAPARTPVWAAGAPAAPARAAGPGSKPGSEPDMLPAPGALEQLPRRRPGTHLASELAMACDEAQPGAGRRRPAPYVPATYTPPPPDVLHRLLEGLRNLK
jgi:uncharacterized protein DUF4388